MEKLPSTPCPEKKASSFSTISLAFLDRFSVFASMETRMSTP